MRAGLMAGHLSTSEYLAYIRDQDIHPGYCNQKIRRYRAFMAWPRMADWFVTSLVERVGRLPGEMHKEPSNPLSFFGRPYLLFLALRGYVNFDYAWMSGAGQIRVDDAATAMGIDLGATELVDETVALGCSRGALSQTPPLADRPPPSGHLHGTASGRDHADALHVIRHTPMLRGL